MLSDPYRFALRANWTILKKYYIHLDYVFLFKFLPHKNLQKNRIKFIYHI